MYFSDWSHSIYPYYDLWAYPKQLFSNKITVFNTTSFYARCGVKQGGVLSGILFSSCYDDLVDLLYAVGAGILVRRMNVYNIKNSLRITIGNNAENKKFIKILRKII